METSTKRQPAILDRLRTPERIQEDLNGLTYNLAPDGETVRSPRRVMRNRTTHCAEGALLATGRWATSSLDRVRLLLWTVIALEVLAFGVGAWKGL